jgi:hypothetical protein
MRETVAIAAAHSVCGIGRRPARLNLTIPPVSRQ